MNRRAQTPKEDMKRAHRFSYLLRLWQVEGRKGSDWQASLETPETGQRLGFANLEQLFGYLMNLSEGKNQVQEQRR